MISQVGAKGNILEDDKTSVDDSCVLEDIVELYNVI